MAAQAMDTLRPDELPLQDLRDETLAHELRDRLAHDTRTSHLRLSVYVDGRVAHVTGDVRTEDERQMLRALLRQQGSMLAVWDLLALQAQPLAVADIGCGGKKQVPSALGVDRVPTPGVDVVADLEGTLPFDDNAFDHVFAVHVVEHIHDLLGLMRELHRVVRPTGVLHVLTPHWQHVNAVADPTHVRFLAPQTFKYLCEPRPGVSLWRPLMISSSNDTVFADLQPLRDGAAASRTEIARWFS